MRNTETHPNLWAKYVTLNEQIFQWFSHHIGRPLAKPKLWLTIGMAILFGTAGMNIASGIAGIVIGGNDNDPAWAARGISDLIVGSLILLYMVMLRIQYKRIKRLEDGIADTYTRLGELTKARDAARAAEVASIAAARAHDQARANYMAHLRSTPAPEASN